MGAFFAILQKELIHIGRDRVSLFLVLAMPIALILLFGFTISSEIRNARISILDFSKDTKSNQLIENITASGYFQVVNFLESETEIDYDFKNKQIKIAMIIPPRFEESLAIDRVANVQIINDVSDINIASILNNYLRSVFNDYIIEYNLNNNALETPIAILTTMKYNPELNSVYMFVPGIITLIMIIITALMSSITLAREKETNTMNMMLITTVKKINIAVGKVIPYMLLSLISTVFILLISVFVFHMPIKGSIGLLIFLCIIFMFTAASFGLLISAVSKTQLDAMMVTMMGLFLPTVLLSGFLFPLDNMPLFFQWLADIFPAKWFIIAIKDVMLKGASFVEIGKYMLILTGMSVFMVGFSLSQIDKR
ncbi:MAG: ABC transporter permease [Bacteroidales bacterium]|nr:ABC transporter permease [Bacteroidales bacterium]